MVAFLLVLWVQMYFTESYARDHLLVKFNPDKRVILNNSIVSKWENGALAYYISADGKDILFGHLPYITYARRLLLGRKVRNKELYDLDLWYVVGVDTTKIGIEKAVRDLSLVPGLSVVEPDYLYPLQRLPNDPYLVNDYYNGEWYPFKIQAIEAWDYTTGDTAVVVGGVDSGVDYDHPDIIDNLAINSGEDLNHNGRIDATDINGADDDGDGFVDNIIGWDFIGNDWDPTPDNSAGSDHGTHVFGIASATTNNGIGIAGIGWKSRGMAFRCGSGEYIYTSAAVNAIYYASNRGVKVLNFSWGSYSPSSSVQDAVNYAYAHDVLMTGAAGNETENVAIYPARFDHVIGVGATGYNDVKTDFSNYGPGVDIMAPGSYILSTVPNGGYESWDGTSMAAPVVMGVAALIRSYSPSLTAAEVESIIIWSADPIDSINPDSLWGKLGAGRVNVYKAIALMTNSNITIITDSVDDGNDGRPSYGENAYIYPLLYNKLHWRGANNITLHIDSIKPQGILEVLDSTASLNSIASGETTYVSNPFSVQVIDTHSTYVTFYITVNSTPHNFKNTLTMDVLVNYPYVLLVDDNYYNERFKHPSAFYEQSLRALNIGYEKITTPLTHTLKFDSIKYVIWFTANDSTEVLTAEEKDSIISFLNNGGNIILSSQYLAETHDSLFLREYLGVNIVSMGIGQRYLKSDSFALQNGIIDSLFFRITGSGGADNDISIDVVSPATSSSIGLLHYVTPLGSGNYGEAAVLYDSGTFKTIFLPWPLEAVDDNATGKNDRADVIRSLLNALGMNISKIKEQSSNPQNVSRRRMDRFYTVVVHSGTDVDLPILTEDGTFEIYNISGERVGSVMVLNGRIKFHFLKSGVYFAFPQSSKLPRLRIIVVK